MMIIFSTSLFILFYTFIGYPLFLSLIKKSDMTSLASSDELPIITVVLCIYNSRSLLEQRINNIFESEYPESKLKILVVSDGSTDKPEEIIAKIDDARIKLLHYNKNQGKSYALSYAKDYINTPYVAFSDIRQTFDPLALKYLASTITQKSVGAVSGNLKIIAENGKEESGLYWKYEKAIRMKESDLHSLLGVTGAIYMAKTNLLPCVPKDSLLDDMYIPLSMVKRGYKIKFCEQAIAYDTESGSVEEEFTRKVRTLAGNYQLIQHLPWLLSPIKNPLFFQFFSHKVARLIMPFALLSLFISSVFIPEQKLPLILQILFYSYSLFSYSFKQIGSKLPFSSTCISFCSLNLAALVATWKYFTVKDMTNLWKKH